MKTLIITAHPSSQAKTHRIAESYKENVLAKQGEVEILDLYTTEYQLPFLSFESVREAGTHPSVAPLREKITWADEIVFVCPVWWAGVPAILKNFLDHVLGAHFAFKYENGKPVGMLTGKTARVFMTAGSPKMLCTLLYGLPISPLKFIWTKLIIEYCGLTLTSYEILSGTNTPDWKPEMLDEYLAHVKTM